MKFTDLEEGDIVDFIHPRCCSYKEKGLVQLNNYG